MKTKTIEVYEFSELGEEAQENAIEQLRSHRERTDYYCDDSYEIDKAIAELRSPRCRPTSDQEDWEGMRARYWLKKYPLKKRVKYPEDYPICHLIKEIETYVIDCGWSLGRAFGQGLSYVAEQLIQSEYEYHTSDEYLREELINLGIELDKEGNLL